jgi:hypothetical protein
VSPPTDAVPQRPRLVWLRLLGVALAGIAAMTAILMVEALLDSSSNLDHTRRIVVLVLIFVAGPLGAGCLWAWWLLSGRYDTAENFVDKPWAFAPRIGPDPADPERVFVEGGYVYQVQVLPARAPLLPVRGEGTGDGGNPFFQLLFEVLTWFGARALDRRWKVAVSRRLRAPAHLWNTLTIEYVDRFETADERLQEIIATWDTARYAALAPLTRAEVRAARKSAP